MITKKYYKLIKVSYADSGYFYVTNTSSSAGTLTINAGNALGNDLEYSTDGVNWTTADSNAPFSLTVPSGANVYMRGTNYNWQNKTLNMDVAHTVGGNILSIIDKTNYASMTSLSGYGSAFYAFFNGNTNLTSAGDMNFGNVTTLTGNCYQYMFWGCTSLVQAPELPATTLASSCYHQMFYGCTSLVQAPELPATTLPNNCYYNMFYDCTSLNSVKIGATTWNTANTDSWLSGVASTGTIYAPTGSDIADNSGSSGVPSGWTVVYY